MKTIGNRSMVFILICLLFLMPLSSFAHGMFLKLEEPGVLKVEYDGGGFSPKTEVIVYDKEGNELKKGPVDEEGKFHFDPDLEIHSAVADDGMGHRAKYQEGVEEKTIPKVPVVIAVFTVIGIIFAMFNKKAKLQQQQ